MIVIGRSYMHAQDLRKMGLRCGENVSVHESCELVGAENIVIGDNVRLDPWCILGAAKGAITIGSYVHIGAGCYLAGNAGIELQDFTGLSQGVHIYSVTDDYSGLSLTNPTVPPEFVTVTSGKVILGRHVIVGSGSVILPSTHIQEGGAVGALSLVKGRTDPWTIYAGVPARALRERQRDIIERQERALLGR